MERGNPGGRWPRHGVILSLSILLLGLPSAGLAEVLPAPETLLVAEDQAAFATFADGLRRLDAGDEAAWSSILDKALADLRRPTKFRGFIQYSRAAVLLDRDRYAEAIVAIEESIRLLPDYTGPLLSAAMIYGYSDQPERGADYLLRASKLSPTDVRAVDDYEITSLLRRLWIKRDDRRAADVGARLLEIGWTGTNVSSRSTLAAKVIQHKLATGDVAGARPFVDKLVVPAHSRTILLSNDYREIWRDVENWAGPELGLQWVIYLNEARTRWETSRQPEILGDYVSALALARHDKTILRDIYPLFDRPLEPERDQDLVFNVSTVAKALMLEGRWQEMNALYAKLDKVWPIGAFANALNLSANHSVFLLIEGRPREALEKMDRVLADAKRRSPEVDTFALSQMLLQWACILSELGRDDEARSIAPAVIASGTPTMLADYHLCMNDRERARDALIKGLANASTRDDVLNFVQEDEEPAYPSAYSRKSKARKEALRRDPLLIAEVRKYGRILPWTLAEGAPAEQL